MTFGLLLGICAGFFCTGLAGVGFGWAACLLLGRNEDRR